MLRSNFIRLSKADGSADESINIAMEFYVSSQLYESDVLSAHELSHGFTKPLTDHPEHLPDELVEVKSSLLTS